MSNSPSPSTRAAQHEMRARVLEAAVSVEYVIDEVLSVTYAKNEALASELQLEVIALLSIEAKLRLLEDVFTAYDLQLVAPALIQTIRDLFALRHLLAHGQVHPPERDGVLRVTTYRRGKVKVVERPLGDVVDLARRSFEAGTALRRIWIWLLPDRTEWYVHAEAQSCT